MGTNAKVMAEHSRIPLDFTYGVIDKCILKALIGKSSLIITSGGMVDHALRRIKTYCQESGIDIEAINLSTEPRFKEENMRGREAITETIAKT